MNAYGSSFASEAKLGVRFNPKVFFIGLDLGYRYALIPYVEDLRFDFSGANIGLNVGFNF